MYAPHVSRFPAVNALLSRLISERRRFKAAVRVLELQPASKGLTLQALLVSTVQRLPRYTLLLRELLTHLGPVAAEAGTAPAGIWWGGADARGARRGGAMLRLGSATVA